MDTDYKIAICDDSSADTDYLSSLVQMWAEQAGKSVHIQTFPSAEAFLFHYDTEKDFGILLLDIEMGRMDGVSLARTIRRENEFIQIIFITGYSEYIADGYEVSALHYLLKPVQQSQLFSVLDRAAERLRRDEKRLLLKTPEGAVLMPLGEIRYLEVRQNYVTVHGRIEVTVKRTLGELEQELDERFYRLGRSFIVNLTCVRRVTRSDVTLADGSVLPLPRGQYEALNRVRKVWSSVLSASIWTPRSPSASGAAYRFRIFPGGAKFGWSMSAIVIQGRRRIPFMI